MSLKQKLISTVTLAFAIVAFTTFASAQTTTTQTQDSVKKQQKSERGDFGRRGGGRKFGKEGRGDKMMMREFSRLDLTDAQKTQIKSLMEANRAANQGTQQELRDLAVKKRGGSITADEQARFETLKAQAKASAEQTHNTILALLTPEQHAQLEQFKAERKQKMQERRQNRQSAPKQTQDN
ncbi:hypothetical protein BH20ACI1_BH20ACI1_17420 [soil metagenome]